MRNRKIMKKETRNATQEKHENHENMKIQCKIKNNENKKY